MKQAMTTTDSIRDSIRAAGLRATPARLATLQMVRDADSPLSHAEVAERLAENGIDKATAFRNLCDMTDVGLLRRTELGDHVYRFEEVRSGETVADAHPHFVCTVCGSVCCMDSVKLTASSRRASEEVGEVTEILLRGRCKNCASQ
ncbi:Fur family transcriptional regulator [Crateriforma conspicua]|nr:transcriptional repressor [Crateriforma conspicua]